MTRNRRASRGAVGYDEGMRGPRTQPISPAPSFDWSAWEIDEEEDMSTTPEHDRISTEFESALRLLARERGWTREGGSLPGAGWAFICKETFFAWVKARPNVRVSPDVYLIWNPVEPAPSSWRLWELGHLPPDFALEVASEDRRKEYDVNPDKYDALGATELVIYDPHGLGGRGRGPLRRYWRQPDGRFEAQETGEPVVYSSVLDVWLVATVGDDGYSLRISRDPNGISIVPTLFEAVLQADRAQRDALAQAEAERQRRIEVERELEQLRALMAVRAAP